jgi:hypothetical protein
MGWIAAIYFFYNLVNIGVLAVRPEIMAWPTASWKVIFSDRLCITGTIAETRFGCHPPHPRSDKMNFYHLW